MAFNINPSTAGTATTSQFLPFPDSISPLPQELKQGLLAPGTTGVLSAACCIAMLLFVIYRFLTWRSHYKTFVGYNQYVVLIVNLLLADMMQGVAFMFSFHWIYVDGILAPTRTCFSQGFLLNLGDVTSGFFVFGIALHTFYGAVHGGHVKHTTFSILVVSAWLLALFLSALGPIVHGNTYFVRAGAWCWASPKYEAERLALHYIWIFLIQFGIIILYTLIFLHLKRTMVYILPREQSSTHAKVDRAAKLMVLFPIAYVILTLPLSAGRMWTRSTGKTLPTAYALVAGTMIGSCGIVDCLLYTLTRRSLVKQDVQDSNKQRSSNAEKQGDSFRMNDFGASGCAGITQTRTVTITGDRLSMISDDCASAHSDPSLSLSRATTQYGSEPQKTPYPTLVAKGASPSSSQERIVTPGINGLDPRQGGRTVEITATAVDADSIVEASYPSVEEVSRIRRAGSPYSMRRALELFKGSSTKG